MALHLVTGFRGEAHITAEDHGAFNAAVFGNVDAVLSIGRRFEAVPETGAIRIHDGELVMQGRHVRISRTDSERVEIEDGTYGMNRNDLIVVRYTKDGTLGHENVEFAVLKGEATTGTAKDPVPTTGDILSESTLLHEMPLYRVKLTGVNVEVELLAEVLPTMKEYIETVKPIKYGGTGASTAAQALKNLGINVAASFLNLLAGATGNIQDQLNKKSNSGHNHDDRYFTESEVNTKLAGKSDTSHNHDGSYLKKYGLNAINIDNTSGNWTVDISTGDHGAVPELWVNVTQTTAGHFTVQTAIKCNKDTNTGRMAGKMWVRDKYTGSDGGDWSAWSQLATQAYAKSLNDETNARITGDVNALLERIRTIESLMSKYH